MREISQPRISLRNHINEEGFERYMVGSVLSLPLLPLQRIHEALDYLERQFMAMQESHVKPKVSFLIFIFCLYNESVLILFAYLRFLV